MLCLTATPVVNELAEPISLLRAVTGLSFDDLTDGEKPEECLAVHRQLCRNGIRFLIESNQTTCIRHPLPPNGTHEKQDEALWIDATHDRDFLKKMDEKKVLPEMLRRTKMKIKCIADYCEESHKEGQRVLV